MNIPDHETKLLPVLGITVLERGTGGVMSVTGTPPAWFGSLLRSAGSHFTFQEIVSLSPFLADFCQEAENLWNGVDGILESGTWSQRNLDGREAAFEAWAIRSGNRKFLLIKLLADFERQHAVFQKLCDMALSLESLGREHRELHEARDALEVRNREVEKVNKLKTDFLASISHELRTPLNAVVGFSKLLGEGTAGILNAEQHMYVQQIATASGHLLTLINEILDLSKIEAGHMELNPECFTFSEGFSEVLSIVRPLARTRDINFVIKIDHDAVYADRLRFKQILYNLLSNAIKFTPPFGQVAVECSRDEASVVITISDSGIGITPEEQEAIFEKFHQVHSPVGGAKEGTGLGLAITRGLVERHGGKIWVESSPGMGARFTFTLPWLSSNAQIASNMLKGGPGVDLLHN